MKEPSEKDLREHRDPMLEYASYDIASFNRFADLYGVPRKERNRSGHGPEHTVVSVGHASKVMTEKGELTLVWGYTIETRKGKVRVTTSVAVERDTDMAHLTHDIEKDKWTLQASVSDSGKLSKLLEGYGIKNGEGCVELKKSRYLLAARDLIEYFHKRLERHSED